MRNRVNLSPTQVLAGSLAAVTSAVAASRLGVAGTLVGAALGSVVATIGQAYYEHYLDRTRRRVRAAVVRRVAMEDDPTQEQPVLSVPASGTIPPSETGRSRAGRVVPERLSRGARWLALALSALAAFTIAVVVLTGYESATGEPISDNGRGTTIGRAVGAISNASQPGDTAGGSTAEPSAPATDTATPEPTVTDTPTPNVTGPTAGPTGQPTGQPTNQPATPTPAATLGSAPGGGSLGGGPTGAPAP
jgi:hypothetical protein